MRNFQLFLTEKQYGLSPHKDCEHNQQQRPTWPLTDPKSQVSQSPKGCMDLNMSQSHDQSMDLNMFGCHDELMKLQINLELNKYVPDKSRFVSTYIPEGQFASRGANIAIGMFRKVEGIKPEVKPKRKFHHMFIEKEKEEAHLFYDTDKSLDVKYPKSPSVLFQKQHPNPLHPLNSPNIVQKRQSSPVAAKAQYRLRVQEGHRQKEKENIRANRVNKSNRSIRVFEDFDQGHSKFKSIMKDAARIAAKHV